MLGCKNKNRGHKVRPLKIVDIREAADAFRDLLEIRSPYLDIVKIYDFVLPQIDVTVDVCTEEELGENHGMTYPDTGVIKIREDVYRRAGEGKGRDRFTLSHEIGHLILHTGIALARGPDPSDHKPYEDSEWQANTFAAEFLMPVEHVCATRSIAEVAKRFGVSCDAARTRLEKLKQQGVLK